MVDVSKFMVSDDKGGTRMMNDQERSALYRSEIASAAASGLKDLPGSGHTFAKDGTRAVPGSGMLRSAETARHMYQNDQQREIDSALTMEEKIIATSQGRQAAYAAASAKGVRYDENVVHRAGVLAVQAAAVAKVAAAKAAT